MQKQNFRLLRIAFFAPIGAQTSAKFNFFLRFSSFFVRKTKFCFSKTYEKRHFALAKRPENLENIVRLILLAIKRNRERAFSSAWLERAPDKGETLVQI